jgi:biotin synthase
MKNYTINEIQKIYHLPLITLVNEASHVHQEQFPKREIQASSLLSLKTGGCPENCSYCPQSAHYETGVKKSDHINKHEVLSAANMALESGASRFCMGAAWREVRDGQEFDQICDLVSEVSALGLEVCCTLGMLNIHQAQKLKKAGLNFYNHNIDTSPEYYQQIIQTRTFKDRLKTLDNVRQANLLVCTGGILGMGESEEDRVSFIFQLVNMPKIPESITINMLIPVVGTPLESTPPLDPLDLVRTIATLRILAPKSHIRLSAGRSKLSSESQFLCFLSGANSLFLGEKLLTAPNSDSTFDENLLKKCGLTLSQSGTQHA